MKMTISASVIETGVDKLVNLINTKGKTSSNDAAKELGVSTTVVMEWADFLEEEGIISIEYKFTKPYLISRKMTKKEVKEKEKEFSGKRDVFVRKAEVSLSFLDREAARLKKIKAEFDKIKKELGFDIGDIKNELLELEKYEQLKTNLDKSIEEQRASAMEKIENMSKEILRERKKYQEVLEGIKKEEKELEKEKIESKSIEQSEKFIKEKLDSLKEAIRNVENRMKAEEDNVKISERNIQSLMGMAKRMKERVEKEKGFIEPLVEKSKNWAAKIKELQDRLIKKVVEKEKRLNTIKKTSKKMKVFFKEKMDILSLIEKVNKDRNDLQRELITLIKKAKSFQLTSKTADIGKEIADIEKKFHEVDNKKKVFEKELRKLGSFLR